MNAFDRVKGMDRIFCGLYLLLGYGFIWMFTNSTSAWCLPVYTVFYAAVVLLYARTLGIRPVKESWFWFVILLILGISQEIDNGMMVGRFLALLLVAAYWTFAVSGRLLDQGRTSGWILFDGWNALGMVPFTNMDALIRVLFHQKSGDGEQDKTSLSEMKAVALGLGIAAVLLCILLPLLSGADAGFEMLTGDVADWITVHLLEFALRMCFAIPVSFYLFGLTFGGLTGRHTDYIKEDMLKKTKNQIQILPVPAAVTTFVLICGVYILFIGLQGSYLFSALAGKLPEAFTYAEYARRGFFELCQVSVWNLCILIMSDLFTSRKDKQFMCLKGMNVCLSVLTLLLITTAIGKMFLYISAYGLTAYRILSLTFMLWLTIIFVGWIIRQWRTFPLARISILTGAVLYTLLCVLPVSSLCRYYNLWAQTHGFLH